MRARGKGSSVGRVEESSRAMLATARPSRFNLQSCSVSGLRRPSWSTTASNCRSKQRYTTILSFHESYLTGPPWVGMPSTVAIGDATTELNIYSTSINAMWVFSQRRPFLLENDDGHSLAGQYAGRGCNRRCRIKLVKIGLWVTFTLMFHTNKKNVKTLVL